MRFILREALIPPSIHTHTQILPLISIKCTGAFLLKKKTKINKQLRMSQGCLGLHLCVKLYNKPSCRVEALQETSLRTLLTNITAKTMVGHGKTTFSRHSKSWSKENSDAGSLILKQSFNSPGGSVSKESACNAGDLGLIPRSGRSPGKGKGNSLHYSCWEIPWTEERGGLQSTGHESVMTA